MKTLGKICPLFKDKCIGSGCAFAAEGKNSSFNKEGDFVVTGKYHYCVVRDFMLSIALRE